jgi:hypothetical protein
MSTSPPGTESGPTAVPPSPTSTWTPPAGLYAPSQTPQRVAPKVWAALAAVVVVVVVVLVLVLSGVLAPSGSKGPGAGSFSGSRGPAQSAANSAAGGPWTLLLVLGVATHGAYSGSASNVTGIASSVSGSSCTYTPSVGAPSSISEAGVGNVSQGGADAWIYMYTNANGSVLLVTVTGSAATVIGTIAGSSCDLAYSGFTPIPSSGIIDSTTASADAGAAGGYAFLAAHPAANATFALIGGYSIAGTSIGATWAIEYLTCALSGAGPSSAPGFLAIVSATTGDVLQARATTVTCPSTSSNPALGTALALGTPLEGVAGSQYWYNFSVQSASSGLTWAETSFSIQNPAGQTLSLPAGSTASVLNLTGTTIASFGFATGTWTGQSSSFITAQHLVSVSTTETLSGDTLVVAGTGNFSGEISVPIP